MACRRCGLPVHASRCKAEDVAAYKATKCAPAVALVANAEPLVANKHGQYADKEKRKAYQRELMRKRRAK